MQIVDLKQPGFMTPRRKEELLAVVKSGYSQSNLLVQCCYDDVSEYIETYMGHIVETFAENEVSVGLVKEGVVVGCVAALGFHVIDAVREGEVDSLDAIKRYRNIVEYLAELDRLAMAKMRAEEATSALYRDFLRHYDSKKPIFELGRGSTLVPNGLSTMLPAAFNACRRLGVRYVIGRTTDHGIKAVNSQGVHVVASLCYKDSDTLRPTPSMSARRRELLTTPSDRTGRPPASHFFIADLQSTKSQL